MKREHGRAIVIWIGLLIALLALNLAIWDKEQALRHGETVYLELAPVDPRSLMQGDYMVLSYAISRAVPAMQLSATSGHMVLRIDEQRIGHFVRLHDGQPLAPDERLLAYKNRRGPHFGIESFFFQEGTAEQYASARYARIRLSPKGTAMLTGLVAEPG